jgi:hypothetical protein
MDHSFIGHAHPPPSAIHDEALAAMQRIATSS